jgi:hypothetical protein
MTLASECPDAFFAMLDCFVLRGFSGSFDSLGVKASFAGDLRDLRVVPFAGVTGAVLEALLLEALGDFLVGLATGCAFGVGAAESALLLDSMLEKDMGSARCGLTSSFTETAGAAWLFGSAFDGVSVDPFIMCDRLDWFCDMRGEAGWGWAGVAEASGRDEGWAWRFGNVGEYGGS